jgi:hypothetical protein
VGSRSVLIAGYGLGALTAGMTGAAFALGLTSLGYLAAIFTAAGLYVAVQEALEATVTADLVEGETLTTSYGALGGVNGAASFVSSAGVGLLWTAVSPATGFAAATLLMIAGTAALARAR